jgi:hypothetical protein
MFYHESQAGDLTARILEKVFGPDRLVFAKEARKRGCTLSQLAATAIAPETRAQMQEKAMGQSSKRQSHGPYAQPKPGKWLPGHCRWLSRAEENRPFSGIETER